MYERLGCGAPHSLRVCDKQCGDYEWRDNCEDGGNAAVVGLNLAEAFEAAGQRENALATLRRATSRVPRNARVLLALAKLLFRANQVQQPRRSSGPTHSGILTALFHSDQKGESEVILQFLIQAWARQQQGESDDSLPLQDFAEGVAGDAYYLAGWVSIHSDDHTNAYQVTHPLCTRHILYNATKLNQFH